LSLNQVSAPSPGGYKSEGKQGTEYIEDQTGTRKW
ncbi:hypothetical protein T05_13289, partial [Trichinella murrelli]